MRGMSCDPKMRGMSCDSKMRGMSLDPKMRGISCDPKLRGMSCDPMMGLCQIYNSTIEESLHFDFKVSSSQAKIDENFANYFLKTKA